MGLCAIPYILLNGDGESVPVFEVGPVGGVWALAMAQPEIVQMFEVHDPWRIERTQIDDFVIVAGIVVAVSSEGKHRFTGIAVVSPIEIILMTADGGGQAVLWSEHVHGARFAVVAAQDACVRALVRRKRVI